MSEPSIHPSAHSSVIVPFNYEGAELRTLLIEGEPWFVAPDACRMLDLRDTTSALKMVDVDDKQNLRRSEGPHFPEGLDSRIHTINVVNESGMWALIFQSNKDQARRVRRWITGTVLPEIRRTGSFNAPAQVIAALPDRKQLAQMVIEAEEARELAEARVAELEPKADLADTYLTAQGGARLVREAAKLFGMKERDLRRFLVDEGLLFVKHAECGDIQYDHYAEHAHHFRARETLVRHTWGTCTHYTIDVLPRGMELIKKRLNAAVGLSKSA